MQIRKNNGPTIRPECEFTIDLSRSEMIDLWCALKTVGAIEGEPNSFHEACEKMASEIHLNIRSFPPKDH